MDFPRRDDVLIALDAVRKACKVCQALQPVGSIPGQEEEPPEGASISTVEKADLSPGTIFASDSDPLVDWVSNIFFLPKSLWQIFLSNL